MALKTVKFGGTSLANAGQFRKVKQIIESDRSRRYVVVSAPGKRDEGDTKVTDMLLSAYESSQSPEQFNENFRAVEARFDSIISDLGLDLSLSDEYEKIKEMFRFRAGRDYIVSRGEYLCARIMSVYLGFDFIDAENVVFFGEDGRLAERKTDEIFGEELKKHEYAVIPGFYGVMPNDTIKTFPRGGSDITGSICARAAKADLYENWTDVPGFFVANPKIVDNPKLIDKITYQELRELSYMGATVLHEDSIFPVRLAGIPICIRDTDDVDAPGTLIIPESPEARKNAPDLTGIAGKKGFSIITIQKDMMNGEIGFCRRVLEVLEKRGISIEHVPTGIDSMCVVVRTEYLDGRRDYILNGICQAVMPDSIMIEDNIALITVVGRGMNDRYGCLAKVLRAVDDAKTSVKMIDAGATEMNVIVGVREEDFEKTVRSLYNEIFA